MKKLLSIFVIIIVAAATLAAQSKPNAEPVTRAEQLEEIQEKMERLNRFMDEQKLGGVLITQVRNFSWVTAGLADNHIVITSESGAVTLLILRDGRKFAIASNSEIPRMMAEDLKGLGYEAREYKWYQDKAADFVRELGKDAAIGTDQAIGDFKLVNLQPLQVPLTQGEIKKYRWLGKNATEAVIATVNKLRPGMSEREFEAIASDELMRRGIRPTVLLMGSDERLAQFRHATPSDARLKQYGMVNICARRWGLVIAVTRFVHFGPLSPELKKRLEAAANVNAHYQAATVPGAKAADILEQAKKWYADAGFPGEWEHHHQGGAIGYGERDWVARPDSTHAVHDRQAFAWNPTVQGAKVEDTILLIDGKIENLTETPGWPVIETKIGDKTYRSPAILVKQAGKAAAKRK